jgi:predicted nucleic acid-binding protein
MPVSVVIDTNILVSALQRGGSTVRTLLRGCLTGAYQPLIGAALYSEYLDVCGRTELFVGSKLIMSEREEVLDAFFSACHWIEIYFLWRPNLSDEADNHLLELAVAGGAAAIITRNIRDFRRAELQFPQIEILTPEVFLECYPCPR